MLPTVMCQLNVALHSIELPPNVPIGPGLYLPHSVGTVINARCIGSNATIQGGVTVGLRTKAEFPEIGDGVTLGAGCRVLGGISVGDGATIGANAVVLCDVPEGATMVGVPARPVRRTHLASAATIEVAAGHAAEVRSATAASDDEVHPESTGQLGEMR